MTMSDHTYIDTGIAPGIAHEPYPIRFCGCRFYDGDTLIQEYIPCRNPDGVVGVYDVAGDKFIDRDSLEKMILEHCSRADKVRVIIGGADHEQSD